MSRSRTHEGSTTIVSHIKLPGDDAHECRVRLHAFLSPSEPLNSYMAPNTETRHYLGVTGIDQRPDQPQTLGERQLKVLEGTLALQDSITLGLCGLD